MKELVATTLFLEILIKVSAKKLKKVMRPSGMKGDHIEALQELQQLAEEAKRAIEAQTLWTEEHQHLAQRATDTQSLSGPLAGRSMDPIAQYFLESDDPKGKRPSKAARWTVLSTLMAASVLSVVVSGQGIVSAASSRVLERVGKGEIKDLSLKVQLTAITVHFAASLVFDMFVLKRSFTQPQDWVAAALAMSFGLSFLARIAKRIMDPNLKVPKPIILSEHEGDSSSKCSDWNWRTWVFERPSDGKLPHGVRAAILTAITGASVASNVVFGQGLTSKTLSGFGSRVFRTETRQWGKKILYTALLTYIVASLIFDVFALGKNPLNFGTLAALPLALDLFIKIGIRHLELLLNPNSVDDDDEDDDEQEKKAKPEIIELTNQMDQLAIDPISSEFDLSVVVPATVPQGRTDSLKSSSPSLSGSASPEEAHSVLLVKPDKLEMADLAHRMATLQLVDPVDDVRQGIADLQIMPRQL